MEVLRKAYCRFAGRFNRFLLVVTLGGIALLVGGFGLELARAILTGA